MECGFLSPLRRGVKEKLSGATHVSAKATTSTSNVVPTEPTSVLGSASGNSSGGSPKVVKDGMNSGYVDPKVMEGVNEPISTIPNCFASLVTNEAATSKVNFKSLDSDKPINAKDEVKIPKASILDVHSRFCFSLYGYFVGKRVVFSVVEYYVKNAWKKFGLVHVMIYSKGLFFFKFALIEGMNEVLENSPWFI
ncbi:zinc knuckle CX2CX4HX4C containing protein [Tanacetum coccineum]